MIAALGRRTQRDREGTRRKEWFGEMLSKPRRVKMPGVTEPCDRLLLCHFACSVCHDEGRNYEGCDKQHPEDSPQALRGFIKWGVQKVWSC